MQNQNNKTKNESIARNSRHENEIGTVFFVNKTLPLLETKWLNRFEETMESAERSSSPISLVFNLKSFYTTLPSILTAKPIEPGETFILKQDNTSSIKEEEMLTNKTYIDSKTKFHDNEVASNDKTRDKRVEIKAKVATYLPESASLENVDINSKEPNSLNEEQYFNHTSIVQERNLDANKSKLLIKIIEVENDLPHEAFDSELPIKTETLTNPTVTTDAKQSAKVNKSDTFGANESQLKGLNRRSNSSNVNVFSETEYQKAEKKFLKEFNNLSKLENILVLSSNEIHKIDVHEKADKMKKEDKKQYKSFEIFAREDSSDESTYSNVKTKNDREEEKVINGNTSREKWILIENDDQTLENKPIQISSVEIHNIKEVDSKGTGETVAILPTTFGTLEPEQSSIKKKNIESGLVDRENENSSKHAIEMRPTKENISLILENDIDHSSSEKSSSSHEDITKEPTTKEYDTSFTILINKWSSKEKVRPIITKNNDFESHPNKDGSSSNTFSKKIFSTYHTTPIGGGIWTRFNP